MSCSNYKNRRARGQWFWLVAFVAVSIVINQWLEANGWLVWVNGYQQFWFEEDVRRWIHGRS